MMVSSVVWFTSFLHLCRWHLEFPTSLQLQSVHTHSTSGWRPFSNAPWFCLYWIRRCMNHLLTYWYVLCVCMYRYCGFRCSSVRRSHLVLTVLPVTTLTVAGARSSPSTSQYYYYVTYLLLFYQLRSGSNQGWKNSDLKIFFKSYFI